MCLCLGEHRFKEKCASIVQLLTEQPSEADDKEAF